MLDESDIKILDMLQNNAKTSRSQIAEEIGLSVPSVSDRLHKMEDAGIIESYYTKVNRHSFGYDIMVFIMVISDSSNYYDKLVEKAHAHPQIQECHAITGEGSHILKAIVKNSGALEKLLAEIQAWPGVLSTRTSFVLSTHKETTNLELK